MNWKHIGKLLAAGAVLLLGVGWGPAAFAQATDPQFNAVTGVFDAGYDPVTGGGTPSGTPIENTAAITSYSVSTVQQVADSNNPTITATSTFLVDRRLNVMVTAGQSLVRVPNLAVFPTLTYTVTNLSNAPIDIHVRAVRTTSASLFPTTGSWAAAANVVLTNTTDTVTSTGATLVLTNVGVGASKTVTVAVDQNLPDALNCSQVEEWHLVAAVANPTAGGTSFVGTAGALVAVDSNGFAAPWGTGTTNALENPNVIEDVFADAPGTIAHNFNVAWVLDTSTAAAPRQGQHADSVVIIPEIANMTITKSSRVVWDPVNGGYAAPAVANGLPFGDVLATLTGGQPRRIPNAIVEYFIEVENALLESGCSTDFEQATASAVTVADAPPANTLADGARPNVFLDGCAADGSYVLGVAVGTGFAQNVGNCVSNASGSVVFYVEIQ